MATDEQIRELVAGPETDAMVHLALTGITTDKHIGHPWLPRARGERRGYHPKECGRCGYVREPARRYERSFETDLCVPLVPKYSSDIAAAWTLLDSWHGDWEIRRQNDHYKVSLYEPSMQGNEWAETLQLAICRIRLRATGWPLAIGGREGT